MNSKIFLAVVLLAGAAAQADTPAPALSIHFVDPQHFTDASYTYHQDRTRSAVLRDIERHLQRLAADKLAPGRSLDIEVLDIDLAGQFEPWRDRAANVRIVREITWPRIALRYTLREGDGIVARGDEQLVDMSFLRSVNLYDREDRLRYEKAMLDHWFERSIASR